MMTNKDNPMASQDENPQEVQTPQTQPPDEPGEIGWPADASEPGDPSVPAPGSGGAVPSVPDAVHPNDGVGGDDEAVDAVVFEDPIVEVSVPEVEPVVEPAGETYSE